MTEFELERLKSITVAANEVYKLNLGSAGYINLHNDTDGRVYISDDENVDSGKSIFVESGSGYSNLSVDGIIYIKAETAGTVQTVARR